MNELIDKVIFGGLYKVPSWQWNNDQSNRQCVPVVDEKGNLWMQDTYQIKSPYQGKAKNTDAQIENMISYSNGKNSWCLKHARSNYYYKNQAMITSEAQLSEYELIADLREYRGVRGGEDYRDYKDEDVIHGIKLFFEHGYSWTYGNIGVTVVRKDAKKNDIALLKKNTQDLLREMKRPYSSKLYAEYVTESLNKIDSSENDLDAISRAKYALKLHEKLCEMEEEYNLFSDNAREEYGIKY